MLLFNTKLFEAIHAMTVSERDSIPDFIASPVFLKKRGKILELYLLIREEVEKYEQGKPYLDTEEEIYEYLSEKAWNQVTFDSMESRLLSVIRKALIYQYAGIDTFKSVLTHEEERQLEIKQLLHLAQFYRERKLNKQFDSTISRLKALQDAPPYTNDYYYNRYLTAFEENEAAAAYRLHNRSDRQAATLDSFDLFYIVGKLSILILGEPPIKEEVELQLRNLEKVSLVPNPLYNRIIELYRNAFKLIWYEEGEDEMILQNYLDALETDVYLLPIEQQRNLYTVARNFCAIQYKKGKNHYLKISFELIKKNLKTGLLYYGNGASSDGILFGAVQNIVAIALKLQESDWVLTFLEAHRTKIIAPNEDERERFYNFNLACYYFQRQEYGEALTLLKTNFDDDRYKLIARALEIKLYFEKSDKNEAEREHLDKRIVAFETYLSRKDMSKLDKSGYRNFIKIVKKLLKLKSISNKELEKKRSIAEREWILKKVEEKKQWKKKILFRV